MTIENPSAWRSASLDGYTLSDRHQRHTYRFPPGSVVRARRSLIRETEIYVGRYLAKRQETKERQRDGAYLVASPVLRVLRKCRLQPEPSN